MKILITTDWYKTMVNGVVTSVENLTKGLMRLFEISVSKESVGFHRELGFEQTELIQLQSYIKYDKSESY